MVRLKSLFLALVYGVGLTRIQYAVDEKFTLFNYQGLEVTQPTFDSLLKEENSFATLMLKAGLDRFYQVWPQTLGLFLPKDGFLMDLIYQYSGPFFTFFMEGQELIPKIGEIGFLRSSGASFSSNDLSKITDKEISEAKKKVVGSYFSNITDEQLQRFYGTIVAETFHIEGDRFTDSKELFQSRVDSLNKGENSHKKITGRRIFKLKDETGSYVFTNFMPLLENPINKFFILENRYSNGYSNRTIYRIKEIQYASLAQVQKHRAGMRERFIQTLGGSLYGFKKAVHMGYKKIHSDLPAVENEIQLYKALSDLICPALTSISGNLDSAFHDFIKVFINSCNKKADLITPEEIKKDRNGVRIATLLNVIANELCAPITDGIKSATQFVNAERVKPLETLKEVQHPASLHLLLAQLYQEKNDPKSEGEVKEYLTKEGLSHVSYLPLTRGLVEERIQKVQKVLDGLKVRSGSLQKLLEESKVLALKKVTS